MSLSIPQEALLKTLAAMTHADTNIQQIEVEAVQEIMKAELGVSVTSADVRMAAHAEFIENRQIHKYLKSVLSQLEMADKTLILRTLRKIVLIDGKVDPNEVEMFNNVAAALKLSAADLVQL